MRIQHRIVGFALSIVFVAGLSARCASSSTPVNSEPIGTSHVVQPVGENDAGETPQQRCDTTNKIPFSPDIIAQYALTDADIQQLQFYSSGTFVLTREVTHQQHDISLHRLVTRNGVQYEEVEVPCLTPGRVISFASSPTGHNDHLFVSFEQGTGGIDFFAYPTRNGGAFSIYPPASSHTTIEFEHSTFALQGDSVLLIDRDQLEMRDGGRHTLRGYTFDGGR